MWKVTLRDIRENFGRFLLSALAVAIGVAFLSGTLAIRDLLASTFSSLTTSTIDEMTVTGDTIADDTYGSFSEPINLDDVEGLADVAGVAFYSPSYQLTSSAYLKSGPALNISAAPSYQFNFSPQIDDSKLTEGTAPGPGEVAIELSTATRNDVQIGDTVVIYFDQPVEYKVSGIAEFGSGMAGASILLMNEADIVARTGEDASSINVVLEPDADPLVVKAAIEQELGDAYTVRTAEEAKAETDEMVGEILNLLNTFLLIFVALALAISTFIISNTFTISVRQRQRQFALLRAMGASPRQVFTVVLLQAVVIGIIGSLLGLLLGQVLLVGIRALIENMGMPLSGSILMTPVTALIAIVIGVIVTVIATIIPSRRAALTPPIEAMRDGGGQTEKPLKTRGIIGAVLLLVGIVATVWGGREANGVVFGIGAALLFIAVIVITPVLIGPFTKAIGWPVERIAPATGRLAVRSLNASPRKTATTTVAFAIGVALVTAGAYVASSLQATIDETVDSGFNVDVALFTQTGVADASAARETLAGVEGVSDAYIMSRMGGVATEINGQQSQALVATPDTRMYDALGTVFLAGGPQAIDDGQAVALESWAVRSGVGMGDTITIVGEGTPVTVTIGAITQDSSIVVGGQDIDVNREVWDQIQPVQQADYVVIGVLADGADAQQVRDAAQAAVADEYVWSLADNESLKGIAASQINMMLTMLYMLLGLSIIISILGIINTLTLSVVDRTREIGLLRAVGMQRSGVRRMIAIESVITTFIGLIVGILLGLLLGATLVEYLSADQEVTHVVPWATLGVMVVVAFVVGILAAILPARKASRMDVLDAISTE